MKHVAMWIVQSNLAKLLVGLWLVFASVLGLAAQNIAVDDGKTYSVKVSANELTRITVEKGRLEKAWSLNTNWDIKADKEGGEIFIRPKDGMSKAFSFFIKDNYGNTYTLVAMPYDIPSETIVLQPNKRVSKTPRAVDQGQPHVVQLKSLIRDMANDAEENYMVTDRNEIVPLWQEARITLIKQYELNDLMGEVYSLQNVSGKEMVLSEREFAGFGEKVKAVSIESLVLQDKEGTRLYVVRAQ